MCIPEISEFYFEGEYIVLKELTFNIKGEIPFKLGLQESEKGFPLILNKEKLGAEEYGIKCTYQGIQIWYGEGRSLFYAVQTLKQLIKQDNFYKIPVCELKDRPKFKTRGIIEGFYGKPWTHQQRLSLIKFLGQYKMNTFFYAPKDDEYHRKNWREDYPEEKKQELAELIQCAKDNFVDFIFSVSPGVSITYSSESDFEKLAGKFCAVMDMGVRSAALLLDDIDKNLKDKNDAEIFQDDFSRAQTYICNKLYNFLSKKYGDIKFIVCPTEYWAMEDSHYKKNIKIELESNIDIIWTGPEVISSKITEEDAKKQQAVYGHTCLLWDNFPVNDGTLQLKLGPVRNRGKELYKYVPGIVSNPMNEAEISKISLMTYADYCWNPLGYKPEYSYDKAMKAYDIKNYKYLKLLYKNCAAFDLCSEYVPEFTEAVQNGIAGNDFKAVNEYLMEIQELIDHLKEIDNAGFTSEISEYENKMKLTVKLGWLALDILKGGSDDGLDGLIADYKADNHKFAGNAVMELVYYAKAKQMPLREKLGQLLMLKIKDHSSNELIRRWSIGNVLLDNKYEHLEDIKQFTDSIKKLNTIPMFIGAVHEGGEVSIIKERFSCMFSEQEIGLDGTKGDAFNNAYLQAIELKTAGINFVLAPVLNLKDEADNGLNSRFFGEKLIEDVVFGTIRAYNNANVVPCGKYFPLFSEEGIESIEELSKNLNAQLDAFKFAFTKALPAVLVSNQLVAEMDENNKVCFSSHVLKDVLRNAMKFQGIIASVFSKEELTAESLFKGLNAGVNLFIIENKNNLDNILKNFEALIDEQVISKLNEAVVYILKCKDKQKNLKIDPANFEFYEELKRGIEKKISEKLGEA